SLLEDSVRVLAIGDKVRDACQLISATGNLFLLQLPPKLLPLILGYERLLHPPHPGLFRCLLLLLGSRLRLLEAKHLKVLARDIHTHCRVATLSGGVSTGVTINHRQEASVAV